MAYNYVIVGSGIAGVTAAKEIRKKDSAGSVLLIGDENCEPYFRIKLSHLMAEEEPELPVLNEEGWCKELNIEAHYDARVRAIDFNAMTLTLEDGKTIEAEKILLANGSHANLPPFENSDLKGVFTLRTFDDLQAIGTYLDDMERVCVIGGGLLGLEAAKSLQARGKDVTIVHRRDYLLSNQLDEELGRMLNEEMEAQGFNVCAGYDTKGFLGKDRVEGIEFSDGTVVDVDCILVSIGVRANIDLFEGTELEVNRGVVVDRYLKTNLENVWAAGDVAEVEGRTMGLWSASRAMGKVAGANMTGDEKTYENPMAFTKLDIGDIEVFSAGKIGDDDDDVYVYDEGDEHHRLYVNDGRVEGVVLYGNTKKMGAYRKFVEKRAPIEEALEGAYPFKLREA
ncbi:MAG: FAD-dependent oxidoreductase [Peptoniphilus sp.]|nr:FAD-dependent oxidoreductase [Peptoniphilus sp.]MDD7362807.1 FAD-dependent oxidoreductase [Bacillota bacterium]MDY6044001.1 FAD-dependent oxidoreductase [Peptoniphilus sp.]